MSFNPPYFLKGKSCVLFCLKKHRESDQQVELDGYKPVKIFNRFVGNIILNHFEEDLPNVEEHSEIIFSTIYRKGFKLLYLTEKLYLDDKLEVERGIKYYHLPKEYNKTVRVKLDKEPKYESDLFNFELKYANFIIQFIGLPIKVIMTILTDIFTRIFPVLGTYKKPYLQAILNIRPNIFKKSKLVCPQKLKIEGFDDYTIFFGQFWEEVESIINGPKEF